MPRAGAPPRARARELLPCCAAAAVIAATVGGCKGKHASGEAAQDAASVDAGAVEGGREARASGAVPKPPQPADDQLPTSTEGMDLRARHLLEAIASDNAVLANDIVFPRDAWIATRDASDPGKDWDHRVATPFRKAIHVLSRHNEALARAQSVTLELGTAVSQDAPRPHAWKKALWTVHGSRITFVVDGQARSLPVRELTGWRGEWYVTRLR
jgi:hypothetical protein